MPQITLTLTDTEARAIAALEDIDGRTVDERFAPYIHDIVRNAAGLREDDEPDEIEARLVKMERARAEAKADALLEALGLTQNKVVERFEVDYLVRQFLGRPGKMDDQEVYVEEINQSAYIQVIDLMLENVEKKLHPLHGGAVPLEHHDFWRKVYDANEKRPPADRWRPAKKIKGDRT